MAGFTNFTAAKVNGKNCYIPMKEVVSDNVIFLCSFRGLSYLLIVCGNVYFQKLSNLLLLIMRKNYSEIIIDYNYWNYLNLNL
jgi:hypothetical protein